MRAICKVRCDKCLFNVRCGGCSMCEGAICSESCNKCAAICPKRGSSVVHLNQILKEDVKLMPNEKYNLSYHIPVLPDRLNYKVKEDLLKTIGIRGNNFLSRNGKKIRNIYSKNGFNKALNVESSVKGILQFYVKDRILECIWDNRLGLYKELAEQDFEAIISPNFSVYEDAPRMDHIYNIQRSITIYNEMRQAGIRAIPDVSWYGLKDLELWIKMINESEIKTAAFSFQVVDVRLKASNAWKNYLAGFRYLCSQISKNVDFIIIGASSAKKAIEIRRAAGENIKLYFLNQSAYIQSQRGMYSGDRSRDIVTPKEKLLEKNIIYFNKLYKEINENGVIECQKAEEIV
ncbi:DUF4417 domain-containing protein [Clostridium sulfidigenes]|uniref:DUF4417 domain-containing protein n=1 Tax=Clostridium sulfidigenes TaxID=318464 RepID=UPI003F8C6072